MSKPYLIVNLIDGKLGAIHQRNTFEEAVATAVDVASQQCNADKSFIQDEIERDTNFIPKDGSFEVCLAQVDD